MTKVSLKIDPKPVSRALVRLDKALGPAMRHIVLKEVTTYERQYRRKRLKRKTGSSLGRRTGTLSRALTSGVRKSGSKGATARRASEVEGFVEFKMPRGKGAIPFVHEEGKVIHAKTKLLTIPLKAALTPAGVPRRKRARDWPDTFITSTPTASGDTVAVIWKKQGNTRAVALYALARRVRIPPRLNFAKDWKAARPRITRNLERGFATFLRRAWGRTAG